MMISATTPPKAPIPLPLPENIANSPVMRDDADYREKSMKQAFVSAGSLFLSLRSFSAAIFGKTLPIRNSQSLRRRVHFHVLAGMSYSYM